MKVRVTRLNFRKDPTFDPNNIIDDYHAKPYVVEFKRHWYSKWKYLIDLDFGIPHLFYGEPNINDIKEFISTQNQI